MSICLYSVFAKYNKICYYVTNKYPLPHSPMGHPHNSRYARLVSVFSASAFALLVTITTQAQGGMSSQAASTVDGAEKCATMLTQGQERCAQKKDACTQAVTAHQAKCAEKVTKKFADCNANAEKARLNCEEKGKADCETRFTTAQAACSTKQGTGTAYCGELALNTSKCESKYETCQGKLEAVHTKCQTKSNS